VKEFYCFGFSYLGRFTTFIIIIKTETINPKRVKDKSIRSNAPVKRDFKKRKAMIKKLTKVPIQSTSRSLFILDKNSDYSNY